MAITPERAVKHVADKLSRRFFWATLALLTVSWCLFVAAILASSIQLAGLGALVVIPAAGCALASIAFHSPTLRKQTTERISKPDA